MLCCKKFLTYVEDQFSFVISICKESTPFRGSWDFHVVMYWAFDFWNSSFPGISFGLDVFLQVEAPYVWNIKSQMDFVCSLKVKEDFPIEEKLNVTSKCGKSHYWSEKQYGHTIH